VLVTCRPSPVRLPETTARRRHPFRRCATTLLLVLAAAGVSSVGAVADPGEIASKRAEVRQVLGQIEELDASLGRAVEAYNAASSKLEEIEHEQAVNRNELRVARANLRYQRAALARRLVAIYTSESDTSSLGVLLGATSLDDLVNRVDTVNRVSDQDARVLREVKQFRASVARHKRQLAAAHGRQSELVQERADAQAAIEGQLAERKQLVESIKGEIVRLQAEERARQAELERQARARLAAIHAARETAAEQSVEPFSTVSVGVPAYTEDATVVPSSRYGGVVGKAMQFLGVPYVWGGASPGGFDCSGLIVYVYAQMGVSLPHYTGALWNVGTPVSYNQLQAGDLVFFNGIGHAGIYIGGGQFVHAPHTGDVVKISSMSDSWYAGSYVGARRIL
jgi:cell wall-associated NlpC family hydrolase